MEHFILPHTDLDSSRLAFGCMGFGGAWDKTPYGKADVDAADRSIACALEAGFNFFDNADIYTRTKAESIFGDVLERHPGLRNKIIVQTKCGIFLRGDPNPESPGRFDFSRAHILEAARASLKRLKCGRIDVLLLHRPDPLMEPEEVAEAFAILKKEGTVRYFGVSNFSGAQMDFLQDALPDSLVANQLEMSLFHYEFVESEITVNQRTSPIPQGMDDTVQYCRKHKVTLQAWSPLAHGRIGSADLRDETPTARECIQLVRKLAAEKGVPPEAVAIAWILKHPAKIQPVTGTIREDRIKACARAMEVKLSREEWYNLFIAARGAPMP
jgi:predicted oxidoreductase